MIAANASKKNEQASLAAELSGREEMEALRKCKLESLGVMLKH
jgi:hypothetical protein